eukprot:gnl/TRDRNA2_/TRDRNA2_154883_c0_seq1.p1 gnl/TRDRNA2_/TRDRNA2_154883_c0~~gnl/TRDRNA2_/TRDRNA2_154883_c0_seq1.p1  ORF type:complete len:363 (+),score=46.16 gnl/TRDRNA2_/TRDRNA2_154883_c0_seq1:211-1299(+)
MPADEWVLRLDGLCEGVLGLVSERTEAGLLRIPDIDTYGLSRRTLVLDVWLSEVGARPPEGLGLSLCVGCDDAGSMWTSGSADDHKEPALGWQCRIETHRWPADSSDALITVGLASCGERAPVRHDGKSDDVVVFEPLPRGQEAIAFCRDARGCSFEAVLSSRSAGLSSATLPTPAMRAAQRSFRQAYADIDGVSLAASGQLAIGRQSDSELTYGEIQFFPFLDCLCQAVRPLPGEVFVDLGSGTGRAVLAAALGYPSLGRCVGFEVVPSLHRAAEHAAAIVTGDKCTSAAPIELHQADFMDSAWEEIADIVWVSSLCMSESTLLHLAKKVQALRPGSRVVTMTESFGEDLGSLEPVLTDGR